MYSPSNLSEYDASNVFDVMVSHPLFALSHRQYLVHSNLSPGEYLHAGIEQYEIEIPESTDPLLAPLAKITKATGIEAAPHLSCIGFPLENIRTVLRDYQVCGIKRVVALRGDLPSGTTGVGELRYANELVEFIRKETGSAFHIEVAAYPEFHPQSSTAADDLQNFKRKVDAGADSAITQYFYNPDAYFRFVDSAERLGIDIPIVPGIMPIINYTQLMRFSDMCGAEIPRWIVHRLRGLRRRPQFDPCLRGRCDDGIVPAPARARCARFAFLQYESI